MATFIELAKKTLEELKVGNPRTIATDTYAHHNWLIHEFEAAIEQAEKQEPVGVAVGHHNYGAGERVSIQWKPGYWPSVGTQFYTHPAPAVPMAESITDAVMNLVDRLGSEARDVDPRAWEHLAVYVPSPAVPEEPLPAVCPHCLCAVIGIPAGWQLVPKEPTEKMGDYGVSAGAKSSFAAHMIYRHMLSAAPKPEEGK